MDYPRPIPPLSPNLEERLDQMAQYLERRLAVCLCDLLLKFHLSKDETESPLAPWLRHAKFDVIELAAGEPLYITTRPEVDRRKLCEEVAEAAADVEYAEGVLEEAFLGYQRGLKRKSQGDAGEQIGRAVAGAIHILVELKLAPEYWASVRFNRTALVLALRQVFGARQVVVPFLRAAAEFPEGVTTAVQRIEQEISSLYRSLQEATAALKASNDHLAEALVRRRA